MMALCANYITVKTYGNNISNITYLVIKHYECLMNIVIKFRDICLENIYCAIEDRRMTIPNLSRDIIYQIYSATLFTICLHSKV